MYFIVLIKSKEKKINAAEFIKIIVQRTSFTKKNMYIDR